MECQQAEMHLVILRSRVNALAAELTAALNHSKSADNRIENLKNALNLIHSNRRERLKEIEDKYEVDLAEQNRQIKLADDVLVEKRKEREALLDYLKGLNLMDSSWIDYKDFDWDALQRAAENLHKPNEDLVNQHQKAEILNEYIQKGRAMINELNESLAAICFSKERVTKAIEDVRGYTKDWNDTRSRQEKRITKLQADNERLNILIKQCVATNEPMSDYLTKNVQAKCQSFLQSESPVELLSGLKKFKLRQDRMIKLLQYKDNQLGGETNKLEVAKDQTHDQLRFYQNLIESRRGAILNNIMGHTTDDDPQQRMAATGA